MIRRLIILFAFLFAFLEGFCQSEVIQVNAKELPLNVILLQLRSQYNFNFSYSEDQVSKYKVTVIKTFESKLEAIEYLLKELPFRVKKVDEVFIIIPDKKKLREGQKREQTQITGQIVEAGSYEPLPFSYILINNHPMVADITGNFNYITYSDSTYHLRVSHLGYFIYDTVFVAPNFRQYKLVPSSIKLPEISVQKNEVEKANMVGETIGKITLNSNISNFLPGQGDNAVFNSIRLMPGIQAAGEQSTDLLIWGSYEGQSLVTFDGFTLFGLKNYNDNISVVNPFLVKTIEILKGGFDSKYGNRVGGIVNIIGKNGNIQKPVYSFNINPMTLNGMVEIPVRKKSSLLLAYRQTYYNLYNSGDFNIFAPTRQAPKNDPFQSGTQNSKIDLSIYPDNYRFRDLNLKFSRNFDNGDQFYVSMYGGGDYFHLAGDGNVTRDIIDVPKGKESTSLNVSLFNEEKNRQYGASFFYSKKWSNNWTTKFILSHSDFSRKVYDQTQTTNSTTSVVYKKDNSKTNNTANENSIRIENLLYFNRGHQLEFGGGFYNNDARIDYYTNINDTLTLNNLNRFVNSRFFAFADDNLPLGDRFTLKSGARINVTTNSARIYFEPRISANYKLTNDLKLNASWGRFHQFVSKIASVDRDQNYSYLWTVSNKDVPVLNATHWVAELNYSHKSLSINIDGYYKVTHDITQRMFERRPAEGGPKDGYFSYFGNAKAYGLDVFAKKDFGAHSIWASYTLSKALESLAPLGEPLPEYTLAPHHQLHEFKTAGLLNIGRFYISADYVYGSGMEILRKVFGNSTGDLSYNRVDAAVTYRFTPKRFSGELGISVMNLFDTQNLKYNNLKNIQLTPELGDVRVYTDAARFTPTIFLKLVF
jgi:Outer membrane receptor proteins, mostly Fe transport